MCEGVGDTAYETDRRKDKNHGRTSARLTQAQVELELPPPEAEVFSYG
jgi:hypothetical protein